MGLLDQAQQQAPQQQHTQQPPQEQPQNNQQEMYERLASTVLDYVYSDQGAQMVLEGLHMEEANIIQNAGNVVAKLIMRLIISVRNSGGAIPAKMMLQIGMELSIAVLEIAEEDGSLPNAEAGTVDAVFNAAFTMVGKELPKDLLSAQERQEVQATLAELQGMQQAPQQAQQTQPNQQRV